jgi:hypothetical protein
VELLLPYLVGTAVVLFHAYDRFNHPFSNRSSTTALCYTAALLLYLAIALSIYYLIAHYPEILWDLLNNFKDIIKDDNDKKRLESFIKYLEAEKYTSHPLIIALFLTVVLVKVPWLSKADQWIREKLYYMAAIPYEVRRLSAELRRVHFQIPKDQEHDLQSKLIDAGIKSEDIMFEENDTPQYLFTKISSLMLSLESWESKRHYSNFLSYFSSDYQNLQEAYKKIVQEAAYTFDITKNISDEIDDRYRDVILKIKKIFLEQNNRLFNNICDIVSRGVLQCSLRLESRNKELNSMGYFLDEKTTLATRQIFSLFICLFFILLIGFSINQPQGGSFGKIMLLVVLIATNFTVATAFAVYPKAKWDFANRSSSGHRPADFYFAAAVSAVVVGAVVGLILNSIYFKSLSEAWGHLGTRYPWYFTTFVMTLMTAYQVDNSIQGSNNKARLYQRCREGGVQALVSGAAGGFVVAVALPLVTRESLVLNKLVAVVILMTVLGFLIGFLVPTWYRDTQSLSKPIAKRDPQHVYYLPPV